MEDKPKVTFETKGKINYNVLLQILLNIIIDLEEGDNTNEYSPNESIDRPTRS